MRGKLFGDNLITPFWIALLEEWCTTRKRSGLCLPFLVGATAIHENSNPDAAFAGKIIGHIRSNNTESTYFRNSRCTQIKVPVIGIHHYPPNQSGYRNFLNESWGKTDEEKLREYTRDSERLISAGRFSRVFAGQGYGWSEFTPEDRQFIQDVSQRQ